MTLPREIGDREYQKFVEDLAGNVAIRIKGMAELVDAGGDRVSIDSGVRNNVKALATRDVEVLENLCAILKEVRELNRKFDLIF